jgi:putative transposase
MALSHAADVIMGRQKHPTEEIVAKLCRVDVLVSQGREVAEAIRSIEVAYSR